MSLLPTFPIPEFCTLQFSPLSHQHPINSGIRQRGSVANAWLLMTGHYFHTDIICVYSLFYVLLLCLWDAEMVRPLLLWSIIMLKRLWQLGLSNKSVARWAGQMQTDWLRYLEGAWLMLLSGTLGTGLTLPAASLKHLNKALIICSFAGGLGQIFLNLRLQASC